MRVICLLITFYSKCMIRQNKLIGMFVKHNNLCDRNHRIGNLCVRFVSEISGVGYSFLMR
jgi:hypothetical protein